MPLVALAANRLSILRFCHRTCRNDSASFALHRLATLITCTHGPGQVRKGFGQINLFNPIVPEGRSLKDGAARPGGGPGLIGRVSTPAIKANRFIAGSSFRGVRRRFRPSGEETPSIAAAKLLTCCLAKRG